MQNLKKFIFFLLVFFSSQSLLLSDVPYFLDFKYILNESNAGKKAQIHLKNKLENGIKNLKTKENKIQEEEKNIIQQKKIISAEEYKKKVSALRKKVSSLQKERETLLTSVSKDRKKARDTLLSNLNPIIKEYMMEKKIRMVIDKKSLLLADEKLDITKDILALLNKKLKSIKLN
jgi:outer membrane protein